MTYCLAMALNDGLIFAADTRTNAGVDYVTSYSKLHAFTPAPDRLFVVLSAGNLATTQEILNWLQRDLDSIDERESLNTVNYLFEAADYIGRVGQSVQQRHYESLARSGVNGETTLILGGQIRGQAPQIFMIYPQGNAIAASPETPYLQIGESKYGKPMLDRIIDPDLSLGDGARLALVSLDATIRSNITVGPPFELAIYRPDTFQLSCKDVIRTDSAYFQQLKTTWQNGLRQAFSQLPRFDWEQ